MKCTVCADFDLCLPCFSVGAEVHPHSNTHHCQIIERIRVTLLTADWAADEELMLLEAISIYGLGNWADIADHVGTKPLEACRSHYFSCYIESKTAPLPDIEAAAARFPDLPRPLPLPPPAPSTTHAKTPRKRPSGTPQETEVGFNPFREEFETEWSNDAEHVITDIAFNAEDTPEETAAKVEAVRAYSAVVFERAKRRAFVTSHDLILRRLDKKHPLEPSLCSLLVFEQVVGREQTEKLIEAYRQEAIFQRRIEQLREWRSRGLKTLAAGNAYEAERRRRRRSTMPKLSRVKDDKRRQDSLPFDEFSSADLLSDSERTLCRFIRMAPRNYLAAKEAVVREIAFRGPLTYQAAVRVLSIERERSAKIIDFLKSNGLVELIG